MGMQYTFKHGEPVWVRMDEFPWWPARIVTRDEIQLDPGEVYPRQKPDELLVEFFNDEKRFAAISKKDLRPFIEGRFRTLNRDYDGEYLETVIIAISEAERYLNEWLGNGVPKVEAKGGDSGNGRGRGGKRRRGRARAEAGEKRRKSNVGSKASSDATAGGDGNSATHLNNVDDAPDLLINDKPAMSAPPSATATTSPHDVPAVPMGTMQMTASVPLQPIVTAPTPALRAPPTSVPMQAPPAAPGVQTVTAALSSQAPASTPAIHPSPLSDAARVSSAAADARAAPSESVRNAQTATTTAANPQTPVVSEGVHATPAPFANNSNDGAPPVESRRVGYGIAAIRGNGFMVEEGGIMEHVPTEPADTHQNKNKQSEDSPNYAVLSQDEMITLLRMRDDAIRQLNARVRELEPGGKSGHEKITAGIQLIRDGQNQILEEEKVKPGRNTG